MTRKWQQWVQDKDVNIWVFLDPFRRIAGDMLEAAILDATPAGPTGPDSGRSLGIGFGIGRGILGGIGRK